ncbi:MAG: hypothetical protein COT14_02420 [Candidatus Diapherotrites archaeon CG08_land_8_20_14_0_20_30_16]|nr:MAG: hypothetical protein COT14_02420 [Candidatus Diapherotrites archaeon CG08_land_8_20_14_0_20_30_16]
MVENYIPMLEKFEELKKVLQNIKKGEKILIIADNDPDGVTSAFIFCRLLEKFGFEYKKEFFCMFTEHDFRGQIKNQPETQKQIAQHKYIFLLDMSMDDYSFLQDSYICVIDHHKADQEVNLLINPMYDDDLKSKPNCSASALVYCAYRYIFGNDKLLQKIAFSGALADWFVIGSLPYLNVDINNEEYFVNSGQILPPLSILLPIYSNLSTEKFGADWVLERMLNNVKIDLKAIVILPEEFYKEYNKYKKRLIKRMQTIFDNAEIFNNTIILELTSKDRKFKPAIQDNLEVIYSSSTRFVFFENKKEKGYQASCRSKDYDLVKLIEFLKTECKTLFGGGHSVAVGFFVKKKEFEKCKKLIIENIDKFRK